MPAHHADVADVGVGPLDNDTPTLETAAKATLADVTDGRLRTPDRSTPRTRGVASAGSGMAMTSRNKAVPRLGGGRAVDRADALLRTRYPVSRPT